MDHKNRSFDFVWVTFVLLTGLALSACQNLATELAGCSTDSPCATETAQIDVIQASSLGGKNVVVNGLVVPASDFSNAQLTIEFEFNNPLNYSFEPYSITLLQIELND